MSHGNCSVNEDTAAAMLHHILTMDKCHRNKIRDFVEHFLWQTSQSWESQQMKKSSLGDFFPSDNSSSAPDEEVIKLLQLLAGDVETNPGPKVSQCVLVCIPGILYHLYLCKHQNLNQ